MFSNEVVTRLAAVGQTGLGSAHLFTYSDAMEMPQMQTPMGGRLRWDYRTWTYKGVQRDQSRDPVGRAEPTQ